MQDFHAFFADKTVVVDNEGHEILLVLIQRFLGDFRGGGDKVFIINLPPLRVQEAPLLAVIMARPHLRHCGVQKESRSTHQVTTTISQS